MARRTGFLLVAATVAATFAGSGDAIAGSCAYDALARTVTVTAGTGDTLKRAGDRIELNGAALCGGTAATVTNTDRVDLTIPREKLLTVDLSAGWLAPGFTDEGDGGSEIEIVARGEGRLVVMGTDGPDDVRAGNTMKALKVNFDTREAVDDADLTTDFPDPYRFLLELGKGDDVLSFDGGAGTGPPLATTIGEGGGRGGDGNDVLTGSTAAGSYSFFAGDAGDDVLRASTGSGLLHGGPGDDELVAGPGEDTLAPGPGTDVLGGTTLGGTDILDFDQDGPPVHVDLQITGPQETGQGILTVPAGIERVNGTPGDDVLRGSAANERLFGHWGDDVLEGRGGSDTLEGWAGDNTAVYSSAPGPVEVTIDPSWSKATGAAGTDTLSNILNVTGSAFADKLTGEDSANRLRGGDGPDVLTGGSGADVLEGGVGADSLAGDEGSDILHPGSTAQGGPDGADAANGGLGSDTLVYEDRTGGVAVQLDGVRNDGADPNADGYSSASEEGDLARWIERVDGGSGPDRIRGYGPRNVFRGFGGDDRLTGGPGSDDLLGGAGTDTVSYLGRAKRVVASLDGQRNDGMDADGNGVAEENDLILEAENLIGGDGADHLTGSAARNVLTGGPGADFLDGFDGTSLIDRLACGTGADTYRTDPSDTTSGCETAVP